MACFETLASNITALLRADATRSLTVRGVSAGISVDNLLAHTAQRNLDPKQVTNGLLYTCKEDRQAKV